MTTSKTTNLRSTDAVRDLSDQVLHSAEQAVEATRDFTHESLDRANDKLRDLQRYANIGADYVSAQPVKSVLIAAATGAAVAALIMALRGRH